MEVRLHPHHHPRRRDCAPAVQLEHQRAHRNRPQPGQPQLLRHMHRGRGPPPAHDAGHERGADRRDDRIQHPRRRQESDTTLGIHIVNQINATASQDISVATDVAKGQTFPDSERHLQAHRPSAGLQFHIPAGHGPAGRFHQHRRRRGPVDLRLPRDVLLRPGTALLMDCGRRRARPGSSQAHGRLQRAPLPRTVLPACRRSCRDASRCRAPRPISLAYVGQKLQELFNSRQAAGSPDPLIRLELNSAQDLR